MTILKFRRGELNCIFATSVAEEGLDIPGCNVIIRFDLYDTLIQYIQSRGRARQAGSDYIHMVEEGNDNHQQAVTQNKEAEKALRKFCEAMPEDRKLTGNNYNMEYFLRKDKGQKHHVVEETGAKLNFRRSLVCLETFVAHLPQPPETSLHPTYAVNSVDGGYQCEVIMPGVSPIRGAIGDVHPSKAMAKCSAAFEICLALLKANYLDSHLRPTFTRQLPAMRNARLAISSRKREEYNMRIKPEIWSDLGEPVTLFVTALTLANPNAVGRASSPILLLTRQPIPAIASFPLFFGKNRSSHARCVPMPGTVGVSSARLQSLVSFTLVVFRDIFSKEYDASGADLPYFLAPTCEDHAFDFTSTMDADLVFNWDLLDFVRENDTIKYDFNSPDKFFLDKFVCDPFDGSRKFFLRGRRHDLKPLDPVPEGVVPPKHRAWKTTCEKHDIFNYSNSLWSKSRGFIKFQEVQPVTEAEMLSIRRNLLDDNIEDEDMEPKKCFLILEPLRISPVSDT